MGRDPPVLEHKRPTPPISIHSPRMGRDNRERASPTRTADFNPLSPHGERQLYSCQVTSWLISIHSPRMGRDQSLMTPPTIQHRFQSTLPAWGETRRAPQSMAETAYFNPLSPHGERHIAKNESEAEAEISIHSPRMGRDADTLCMGV